METGIVKWFDPRLGFGFILRDSVPEGEADHEIFVHYSHVNMSGFKTLLPDLRVKFEVVPGVKKGSVEAREVTIIPPEFVLEQQNEIKPEEKD
ncbi:MAG: cold-shock protein [Promethearchaeota archaeon]